MTAVFVGLAAFAAGWFARALFANRAPATPRRTTRLAHDEYLQRYGRLQTAYADSIKEYDRLVTWVSGGTLGLSVTFVERLGDVPAESASQLVWGWALLGAALFASLYSQYASSRTHSWRLRELQHLQLEAADRQTGWAREAVRLHRVARTYGWTTKVLTFVSGGLLVGGFMLLASFAFHNSRAVTETREVQIPEKRGLEDLPEPLPRPATTVVPTPTPAPAAQPKQP